MRGELVTGERKPSIESAADSRYHGENFCLLTIMGVEGGREDASPIVPNFEADNLRNCFF